MDKIKKGDSILIKYPKLGTLYRSQGHWGNGNTSPRMLEFAAREYYTKSNRLWLCSNHWTYFNNQRHVQIDFYLNVHAKDVDIELWDNAEYVADKPFDININIAYVTKNSFYGDDMRPVYLLAGNEIEIRLQSPISFPASDNMNDNIEKYKEIYSQLKLIQYKDSNLYKLKYGFWMHCGWL